MALSILLFGSWVALIAAHSGRSERDLYDNEEEGLSAFKVDSHKTGSVFGADHVGGYGSAGNGYWSSAYGGTDGQPDMQAWQGALGSVAGAGAAGTQDTNAGFGQSYGTGAIGTPNSPYAGYLEKQISTYPVMIYTLNDCIPCKRAKHLLAVHYPDVGAHFLELSGNEAWQQQLQVDLQYLTGAITFPYIFVCGQYIGGASDLFEMHENGQLRRMVTQCMKSATPKP